MESHIVSVFSEAGSLIGQCLGKAVARFLFVKPSAQYQWMTVSDTARMLDYSEEHVREKCRDEWEDRGVAKKDGKGRAWRIDVSRLIQEGENS